MMDGDDRGHRRGRLGFCHVVSFRAMSHGRGVGEHFSRRVPLEGGRRGGLVNIWWRWRDREETGEGARGERGGFFVS